MRKYTWPEWSRGLGQPGGKAELAELERRFAESKASAGLHQRTPAVIHRTGHLDGQFQLADGKVGVQRPPEDPAEDHVASRVEFLISQVLDGQPDNHTEGHQCDAAGVLYA